MALSPERQSARMSEIKNGGLDQYGKVESLNRIGSKRVKKLEVSMMTRQQKLQRCEN